MRVSRQRVFSLFACIGLVTILASAALSAETRQPGKTADHEGGELYRIYCLNCHGKRGLGDGPTADALGVVPANLTRLAKLNKGVFPTERVYKSIDGRAEVRGHGERRMPIWGLAFQEYDRDTNQEAEVRFRINKLVGYLRSIQE